MNTADRERKIISGIKTILVDMDDTLIPNLQDFGHGVLESTKFLLNEFWSDIPDYSFEQIDLAKIVIKSIGYRSPHVEVIINKQSQKYAKIGRGIDDLRTSFLDTYHEITEGLALPVKEETDEEIEFLVEGLLPDQTEEIRTIAQSIINIEQRLDSDRVAIYGFTSKRFISTLEAMYRHICNWVEQTPKVDCMKAIKGLAAHYFTNEWYSSQEMIPGTAKTLDYWRNETDLELILFTKGEKAVQERKIRSYGINKWFEKDEIEIVDFKDKKTIQDIIGDRDPKTIIKVGNSIRSDINSATDAGLRGAIYIPLETWRYEKIHNGINDYSKVIVRQTIEELIPLFKEYKK